LRNSDEVPIRPERIAKELGEWLPSNAVLVVDTFHAALWTAQMAKMKSGQRYIRCGGSLGWGFPGTLGVKAALPNTPVIGFAGDAGFYYHMAENGNRCALRPQRGDGGQQQLLRRRGGIRGIPARSEFRQGWRIPWAARVFALKRLPTYEMRSTRHWRAASLRLLKSSAMRRYAPSVAGRRRELLANRRIERSVMAMRSIVSGSRLLVALSVLAVFSAVSQAQDTYPARPIRIVVPSGSGAGSDILARMIAQRLTERLGKQWSWKTAPAPAT
jgi:hypothetical protein